MDMEVPRMCDQPESAPYRRILEMCRKEGQGGTDTAPPSSLESAPWRVHLQSAPQKSARAFCGNPQLLIETTGIFLEVSHCVAIDTGAAAVTSHPPNTRNATIDTAPCRNRSSTRPSNHPNRKASRQPVAAMRQRRLLVGLEQCDS